MNEELRRSEIIQAEQAIRMLAEEMAGARQSAAAADDVAVRLQQAIDTLSATGQSVSMALRTQSELAESTVGAVRNSHEESCQALGNATENLSEALREVREAYVQFQGAVDTVGASAAEHARQTAGQFAERLDKLAAAVESLEKSVWQMHVVVRPVEEKLGDLSSSILAATTAVTELRQEVRRQPIELASQIRRSLARRTGLLVGIMIASGLSLVGVVIIVLQLAASL